MNPALLRLVVNKTTALNGIEFSRKLAGKPSPGIHTMRKSLLSTCTFFNACLREFSVDISCKQVQESNWLLPAKDILGRVIVEINNLREITRHRPTKIFSPEHWRGKEKAKWEKGPKLSQEITEAWSANYYWILTTFSLWWKPCAVSVRKEC